MCRVRAHYLPSERGRAQHKRSLVTIFLSFILLIFFNFLYFMIFLNILSFNCFFLCLFYLFFIYFIYLFTFGIFPEFLSATIHLKICIITKIPNSTTNTLSYIPLLKLPPTISTSSVKSFDIFNITHLSLESLALFGSSFAKTIKTLGFLKYNF